MEEGKCNQECWCHVPTRGIKKPPCYLCVLQNCSRSYVPMADPEPEQRAEASPPPPYWGPVAFGCMEYFGLQIQAANESPLSTNTEENPSSFTKEPCPLYVDMDKGAVGAGPDLASDSSCGSVPGDLITFDDQVMSGWPNESGRHRPSGPQAKDEAYDCIGQEKEKEKRDLSDRIKSLVLGDDDWLLQDSALGSSLSDPVMEEEYQRIHKINRRESSREAARRHLQRRESFTRRQMGRSILGLSSRGKGRTVTLYWSGEGPAS